VKPYFDDGQVQLFLGDCREVLPSLGLEADCVIADPPYGETSLKWDKWPAGWLDAAALVSSSLWCFGSMRMFLDKRGEFAGWKLSQDVIWEKQNGTGPAADRFKRVHEHVLHWYRGGWGGVHRDVPRVPAKPGQVARNGTAARISPSRDHLGKYGTARAWTDDGTRLTTSVIKVANLRGRAIHKTEKPVPLLLPLISYACPPGGLVVAPFAGSGSDLDAARQLGCRAIGIEADERECEKAARRLSQMILGGEAS
jgi:site-specific DNA-methyltransferase (adenine-specific)